MSDDCAGTSRDPVGLDSPTFRLLGASLGKVVDPDVEGAVDTGLKVEIGFVVAVGPEGALLAAAFPLMLMTSVVGSVMTESSMAESSQLSKSPSSN